ncbi:MAG: ABC transporter substrate-binding protein [Acidobacteriaceae bacterium]
MAKLRIASLQPSVTLTLADIGELDQLVACTKYCAEICPDVLTGGKLIIQDSWTARADEILDAKPDLVIASVPYQKEAVAQIIKAGVRFLGFAPKDLADVYEDIRMIARVAGAAVRGEAVIREMQWAIGEIRRATAFYPKLSVFCEEWGKPLIQSQAWVAELVEAAGGKFLGTPGAQLTPEAVRDMNPEATIAAWCGAGDRVPLEKIVRERRWLETDAARSGRVFCIADELLNTPATTLVGGLRAIAWALHPERFDKPLGVFKMEELQEVKAS